MKGIILSGMPAVGKTTVAHSLCKEFNIKYYSGGDMLKEIAQEKGFAISGLDWWDNEDGMKFLSNRMQDSSFDKLVDQRLIDLYGLKLLKQIVHFVSVLEIQFRLRNLLKSLMSVIQKTNKSMKNCIV